MIHISASGISNRLHHGLIVATGRGSRDCDVAFVVVEVDGELSASLVPGMSVVGVVLKVLLFACLFAGLLSKVKCCQVITRVDKGVLNIVALT